jgi:hypothetical protein
VRTYLSSNAPEDAQKQALAKKVVLFVNRLMAKGWFPWPGVLEYEDFDEYAERFCEEAGPIDQKDAKAAGRRWLALSSGRTKSKLFIQAVRDCPDLPEEVRANAAEARDIRESSFDQTYMTFLDTQIQLSPRGPKWTEILRRRQEGLFPYCGVPLLSGHIRVGRFVTWVNVDPKFKTVVFWEQLEDDYGVS